IDGLETIDHLTNERAYDLPALPSRLAVLGAGPVGVELAQAFARLGSRVTLIEQAEHPLPQEDPEIAERLREVLEADGLTVRTGARVERVHRAGDATRLAGPGGLDVEADAVLIAVGRRPNVEDLDLEAAGVTYSSAGIEVDRRQRTANRRIYACGDVCGPYAFTHVAEHQAGIVLANAVFRLPRKTDYSATPWVVFTDPELARVGLTEGQARARGLEPKVMRLELGGLDRALTEAEERGLVKLVTHRDRLLGASLLAPRAGELVHEIVLGMRLGARARDISAAIHAYPTYAQAHRRAVNEAYAERLFAPATRRLVRWLNRLLP
nr:FAD-dependent oxidoreductase [Gammaproteobacteria bacterium]